MDLSKYIHFVEIFLMAVGSITCIATVVVKITPTPKDDEALSKFMIYYQKLLAWMPTIGVNPRTKNLLEFYEENK